VENLNVHVQKSVFGRLNNI